MNALSPASLDAHSYRPGLAAHKRVLLRTCLNLSFDAAGDISDRSRYDESLPCIRQLAQEASFLLITAHLGRPKAPTPELSFRFLVERLSTDLSKPVTFVDSLEQLDQLLADPSGVSGVFLLENIRFFPGEDAKETEIRHEFASRLTRGMDLFVNDAFADYRASASTYEVARLIPSLLGPLFAREIHALDSVKTNPQHPFVVVLGGAKLSEKLDVLMTLLPQADRVLIGGAMAYTLLKAQGIAVGKSLVEDDKLDIARQMLSQYGDKIILPVDHAIVTQFADPGERIDVTTDAHIPIDAIAVDVGPKTREWYTSHITNAKTILRNGPMGVCEWKATRAGTETIGTCIAQQTQAYTLVGGGDSIAAINALGLTGFSHICTGGGAMLAYLGDEGFPTLEVVSG